MIFIFFGSDFCHFFVLSDIFHLQIPYRLKKEEQLQQHYSDIVLKLNAIIDTATDGIISIDERGIMEMVNAAAAKLFDYEISELIGRNISSLMPEPDSSRHDGYIMNYLRTGERKIIGIGREVRGKRKDGSIFPLRLSISEVNLHNRRIFTGIVHDLTEQKKTEEALRKEKERTQLYLDIANTIFLVIDKDKNVTMLNRKGCEIVGYCEEEVLGKNWFDVAVIESERAHVRTLFRQMMPNAPEQLEYIEYHIYNKKNNATYLIAWHNSVIHNENGELFAIISAGVDITEHRKAEERINRLNVELEQRVEQRTEELASAVNQLLNTNNQLKKEIVEREAAENALRESEQEIRKALEREKELSELKSRFVSMASHEFRTPLSTILSSADLVEAYQKEEQQEKRIRHTGRIKSAVANLTNILNDFLSLSRFEEGKVEISPVEFDITEFCNETLDEIKVLLKSGQEIQHQNNQSGAILFLDKKMLKNILFNLLSNAIKYSGEGKMIDCNLHITEETLLITIIDQGIGIPEEEQQHLFTPFFRAHNVENIQGTGLGLNIVKRYVDLMQGDIRFESELGKGTTIYITLPLQEVNT
ncbi:MAG: PAS domain S-box protein [Saprospiraceae bacterium]|nr:PAS domain S-box protein [Saprospiraceae bacterium]